MCHTGRLPDSVLQLWETDPAALACVPLVQLHAAAFSANSQFGFRWFRTFACGARIARAYTIPYDAAAGGGGAEPVGARMGRRCSPPVASYTFSVQSSGDLESG